MNHAARLSLFFLGAGGVAILFVLAFVRLPGPDFLRSRYALRINNNVVSERNVTDAITAVNFDYRGFDTLGEEFILFVSVMGSLVLLREPEEKKQVPLPDAMTPGRDVPSTDAMRLWILAMVAPKVLFGLYTVLHGQLSPGGGFQGGVILATSPLIIYLAVGFESFKKIVSFELMHMTEAAGAGLYAVIGVIAFFRGTEFLANVLPMGKYGELTSGGIIPLLNFAVGMEVTAGFVLLLFAFLQQNLTREEPAEDT